MSPSDDLFADARSAVLWHQSALLQRQGEEGTGVGSAIAIQNFFENLSMLALVAGYTAASFMGVPVNGIAVDVGLFTALAMAR